MELELQDDRELKFILGSLWNRPVLGADTPYFQEALKALEAASDLYYDELGNLNFNMPIQLKTTPTKVLLPSCGPWLKKRLQETEWLPAAAICVANIISRMGAP